jgi:hypothetical protein
MSITEREKFISHKKAKFIVRVVIITEERTMKGNTTDRGSLGVVKETTFVILTGKLFPRTENNG